MNNEMELEVFRSGDYGTKGNWPDAALDQIIKDYDPKLHEAPVTLDHAQEGPALGWVGGLRRCGDRLLARLRGLNRGLMDLLRQGAFKKRSVELYKNLPETGGPYLKAVSFLGAATPAVKGLSDPIFGEDAPATNFRKELGGYVPFDFQESGTGIPPVIPQGEIRSADGQDAHAVIPFAELETELRQSGRWVPAWDAQGIREFCDGLALFGKIQISPDRTVSPVEWFASFLKSLPVYLPMGESAPRSAASGAGFPARAFTGANVNPASLELHRRAAALCQSRPDLDYARALLECAKG